jgi:stage III sporulation protein AF
MPNGNMKKYMRLFCGVILIIILINPILTYSGLMQTLNYNVIMNDFKVKSMSSEGESNKYTDIQSDITTKIYKERMEAHISQLLKREEITATKVKVNIDEDNKSENYGMITEVFLTVKDGYINNNNSDIKGVKIDNIIINESSNKKKPRTAQGILIEKKVKKIINNFYNLSSNNIHITIETC